MIKILNNGMEKKYYAKCDKCATDMEYEHSDVKFETPTTGYNYGEIKSIKCPVCGKTIIVNLLTKEEYDIKNRNSSLAYCCC